MDCNSVPSVVQPVGSRYTDRAILAPIKVNENVLIVIASVKSICVLKQVTSQNLLTNIM
jgi:hypothetical protein